MLAARNLPGIRPLRALIDPRAQQADLLRRESLAFRRHDRIGVEPRDEVHQFALRTLAGDEGSAIVTALHCRGPAIQSQAALLLFRAVTLHATIREQRLNIGN